MDELDSIGWPHIRPAKGRDLPLPLPRRPTSFPDEHAEIKEMNWRTQYVQLLPGLFEGALFDMEMAGVTVGLEEYNLPMEEMFCAPPGKFFYFRARSNGEAFCEGQALNGEFGLICADEALLHFLVRGDYSGFYVAIDQDLLDVLLADFDWRAYFRLRKWISVSAERTAMLDAAVFDLLKCLSDDPRNAELVDRGENVALAAGSVVADLDIQASSRPSLDTRTYLFRKARDYILDRITEDFTVAELCEALRVSQRTLEYSFADITALSPKRYILTQRLNRVRSDILAKGARTDVLDLAYKWGFHHPSRFSQQYRRHFHELPSATKGRLIGGLGNAERGRVSK